MNETARAKTNPEHYKASKNTRLGNMKQCLSDKI